MDARVELAKDDYAVLSLPEHGNALGFAPASDFNLRPGDAARSFAPGQRVTATVAAAASPETGAQLSLMVGATYSLVFRLRCKGVHSSADTVQEASDTLTRLHTSDIQRWCCSPLYP